VVINDHLAESSFRSGNI